MSECLPDLPRYVRQRDGEWLGADHPNGPWRSIPAPQSGLPWPTDGPAVPQEGREGEATMAEDALIALERIARGDASHGSDDLDLIAVALGQLRRYGAAPPPVELPPSYIDPKHSGEDRRLLEVFYRACNAEGGTADEIHLRGIRAVLDSRPAAVATAPAPLEGEVAKERIWPPDEILNLSDGVEVNEVLGIIDAHTPEWV